MASFSNVAKAKHATLAASTVDTVGFLSSAGRFDIVNLGASDLYVRSDGVDPTVAGDDTDLCRAGDWIIHEPTAGVSAEVRLISSGASEYHVARIEVVRREH